MDDNSDTGAPPAVEPRQLEKSRSPSHCDRPAERHADPPQQGCHGRVVADDEESGEEPDQLEEEEEDLDDVYGGLNGATADTLSKEVCYWLCDHFQLEYSSKFIACAIQ